jgi:hypothetical protein
MKFVRRQDIIDFYLDLISSGQDLSEEQLQILTYLSKIENDES